MRSWICVSLLASTAFAQSVPTIHGIGNAAAYGSNVAGSIVALYGSFFAAGRPVSAPSAPLPVKLNGVQVMMNGIAAPLFYVGSDQINAQVPWELATASSLSTRVVSQGVTSDAMTVPLSPAGPGVFVITSATDGSLVRISSPANIVAPAAAPGQYLTVYATGLGAVTNQPATGAVALSDPLSKSTLNTSVSIGGIPAAVVFSGLTPGFAGLYQVNVQVPAGAAGGDSVPFGLTVGGVSNKLTIGVQSTKLPSAPVSVSPPSATVQASKTIQFTATAGSAVAWSVDGIVGGDSTVGTISNSGLYTAPASLPFSDPAYTFTVSVTSVANSSNAASAAVNVTTQSTSQGPAITSLSTTSAVPMTPLQIRTTGLNTSTPVQVKFTGSSKYSVSEPALSVGSDGTVTVGVPLYVDLSKGQITGGAVSVIVTQGSQSSAPMPLSIQDLPLLSTYGVQPGQISDAVLVLAATLEAQRLNQLQAIQQLSGNTVDTSQAQATLRHMLNALIAARSDVDRVAANSSLSINQGTRGDGVSIQFDQSALDLMDRVNAVFLNQTLASVLTGLPAAHFQNGVDQRDATAAFWIQQLIGLTKDVGKVNDTIIAALKADKAKDWIDNLEAAATAAKVVAEMIPDGQLAAFSKQTVGVGLAVLANSRVIAGTFANLAAYTTGAVTGDRAVQDAAIAAMKESNSKGQLYDALFDLTTALIGGPTLAAKGPVLELIGSSLGMAKGFYDISKEAWEHGDEIFFEAATEYPSLDPDPRHGIAQVIGIAPPFNPLAGSLEQGITSPQSGTSLCGFGSSSLCLTSLSDTAGSYIMYVPLQVPGTNYGTLSMNAQDPLSGTVIGSEVVDLRNLDTSKPVQVAAIVPQGGNPASTLTWTVGGSVSAAGMTQSFSGSVTMPASGGGGKFSSGSATVSVSASASTFSVSGSGFGSGEGVSCGGSVSGSGPILSTPTGFSATGAVSGSAHCTFEDDGSTEDFPISGSFSASAHN